MCHMTPRKPKSAFLSTRVSPAVRKQFLAKSSVYGTPAEVLREIIEAFNDGRLIISPPVNVKGNLYVTRSQT
jgi:hypothetical protein